jgi:type III secretory pathway component EscT
MDFRLRMILWIPTLAYAAFLLLGGKNLASLGQVVTEAFLGALLGFLLAIMFTIRQHRRQRLREIRFAR